MPPKDGTLTLGDQIMELREIHAPEGICELKRERVDKKLDALNSSVGALQNDVGIAKVKLALVVGIAVGFPSYVTAIVMVLKYLNKIP
jgi:hypothetical protein